MDRRRRKTRQAILDACIQFIAEHGDLEKITVHEIVQRADINRGTFYLHFKDKYDMMSSFEDEMIANIKKVLIENMPEGPSQEQFVQSRYDTAIQLMHCFLDHQKLVRLILQSSLNRSFQLKMRRLVREMFIEVVTPTIQDHPGQVPVDIFVIFFTSAVLALAEYVLLSDSPVEPGVLVDYFFRMMLNGPARAIGLLADDFPAIEVRSLRHMKSGNV